MIVTTMEEKQPQVKSDGDNLSHQLADYSRSESQYRMTDLVTKRTTITGSAPEDANCCTRGIYRFNAFIWKNQASLLKVDHLKAAPCVSSRCLMILRIFISLILIG